MLIAVVCTGLAAYYGGWAVVTVENLPDQLVVGTPYQLTFSVRQHGRELLRDLTPTVQLRSGRRHLSVRAVATDRAGYYTAALNVPAEGEWEATIVSSFRESRLKLMPLPAVARGRSARQLTLADRGHRLFVAKGCTACHVHARVEGSGAYNTGPELTALRFAPDYLRAFLADPAIKPPTRESRMPNLNLNAAEIAALTAFMNGESGVRAAATH